MAAKPVMTHRLNKTTYSDIFGNMNKLKLISLLAFLCTGTILNSCKDNTVNPVQTSSHMTVIGQKDTPGNSLGIYVTTVNNINYAFIADGVAGLQIINVSIPGAPSIVGNYNTIGEATDVFVSRINGVPYACVSDGFGGFAVVDVSNPANPVPDSVISFQNDYVNTSFVDSTNRIAYVGTQAGNLAVYDLSGLPATINRLGGDTTASAINGIQITNNLAYLAIGDLGLEIELVSNPGQPTFVSSFNTPGNSQYVRLGGSYAYIADGGAGITVLDVTNAFNPLFYRSIPTFNNAIGIFYYPNSAQIYTAEGAGGCETFSVAGSPPGATQLGYYNNTIQSNAVYFNYPYIYLANGQNGLLILQYSP